MGATNRGRAPDSAEKMKKLTQYLPEDFIEDELKTVKVEGRTPKKDITDKYKLYQTWKLLVRGESMAWSHPWCNNKKSQTPFISLKYKICKQKN